MLSLICTINKTELLTEFNKIIELLSSDDKIIYKRMAILLVKKDRRNLTKIHSDYKYRDKRKLAIRTTISIIFGLFVVPFVIMFFRRGSNWITLLSFIDQTNNWVSYEGSLAALYTQDYLYFSNVNATDDIKSETVTLKFQRFTWCQESDVGVSIKFKIIPLPQELVHLFLVLFYM